VVRFVVKGDFSNLAALTVEDLGGAGVRVQHVQWIQFPSQDYLLPPLESEGCYQGLQCVKELR
jgi:hypothetical protein